MISTTFSVQSLPSIQKAKKNGSFIENYTPFDAIPLNLLGVASITTSCEIVFGVQPAPHKAKKVRFYIHSNFPFHRGIFSPSQYTNTNSIFQSIEFLIHGSCNVQSDGHFDLDLTLVHGSIDL